MKIDPLIIKKDFPIFKNYPELVYLDTAATSQKPQSVIDAVSEFYEKYNANIHRGIYKLSESATEKYEKVREKVAKFIGCQNPREIVFTKNTNESINLVAFGWAKKNLKKDDIVVLSEMEHHANIVPWIKLKEEIGIEIFYLPLDSNFKLNYEIFTHARLNLAKLKLVSLTHVSNVLGTINPIAEIISYFKNLSFNAKICIDAAQSIPHIPININDLCCDFLAFSSHKMLGPSGVGVLWTKKKLLEEMDPLIFGSNMISTVTPNKALWADIPDRYEAGTPNLEGVTGFGAAIDYLNDLGMSNVQKHDKELTKYGLKKLSEVNELKIYGPNTAENRSAIFSFGFDGIHPHDIAQILDEEGICIRSGHHCAQPLMEYLMVNATARASTYIYNTVQDIDKLANGLNKVKKILKYE